MATNSFNTVDWLSMESLRLLTNKLQVAQFFDTSYSKEYTKEFAVGETVRINFPWRPGIRNGLAYNPQAVERINTTVTVDQIFGVDFEMDDIETALSVERGRERFKKEYMAPAMSQIAQEIDSRVAQFAMQNCPNIIGALGTDPSSMTTINQARQKMVELGGWYGDKRDRGMIIPPSVNTSLVASVQTQFNPTSEISKNYKEGSIGMAMGFDWYESMSLYEHTAGVWQTPASVTVSGADQDGDSLLLNCTSGDTFKKGDVFSIASVNAVNPATRRSTGAARTFVVTADTTATGATVTVPIYPTIYGPGSSYQNVDALPGNAALLTLFPGTTAPSTGPKAGFNGLAMHKDAFALVGVKLQVPKAVEMASQTQDPDSGLSVRFIRAFDPIQSKMVNRFDVLMGFGRLHADACSVRVLCG